MFLKVKNGSAEHQLYLLRLVNLTSLLLSTFTLIFTEKMCFILHGLENYFKHNLLLIAAF